jgi:glyoxylase-like metal-dependent hydrolase (beta-lactamase superfamily II)
MSVDVSPFYDEATGTITYVVAEPLSRHCAVIDPVLDYDASSGRTATTGAGTVAQFIMEQGYTVDWILETHVHADHMTGACHLQGKLGGQRGIGAEIVAVQRTFAEIFNLDAGFSANGSQFDRLFEDDAELSMGELTLKVIHSPGHTPACVCYQVGDAVFTGDTVFMPDFGTARCDFPGGDARTLFHSIRRILALPPETRVFVGHDYGTKERSPAWETTIAAERASSIHVRDDVSEEAFVAMREARDVELGYPKLILPSIQVNIRGGKFPDPDSNGVSYLKIPLNAL